MSALTRVKNHSNVSFVQNVLSRNSSARTTPALVLKDLDHDEILYVIPYFTFLIKMFYLIIVTTSTTRNPHNGDEAMDGDSVLRTPRTFHSYQRR